MAYSKRSKKGRRSYSKRTRRRGYSKRSYKSKRSSRSGGSRQTLRIVIEQPQAAPALPGTLQSETSSKKGKF